MQQIDFKIGNLHREVGRAFLHTRKYGYYVLFFWVAKLICTGILVCISKAACLLCLPVFVGCEYFSRPAKEHAPEIGRIYAVICPMSHFSFMSFG